MREPSSTTDGLATLLQAVARTPSEVLAPGSTPLAGGGSHAVFVGRFEVLRLIGQGAFGAVYEARDTELGRHVAVKLVQPWRLEKGGAGREALLDMFRHEAAAAARLNHPNIVTIHDFGTEDGVPYLILELLVGETLSARLARGALPPAEAAAILAAICRGLAHAHAASVVHRDLKPGNIFLREDGQVKLLDFGLARMTGIQPRGGTPAYMAPEQQRGDLEDERTDVYACGVVLSEMLCGGLEPRATMVDPALAAIADRARAREAADRFASAGALLEALLAARERAGADAEPYRYLEPFTEDASGWFFGRDGDVARLAKMLATRPLMALVGPSGAGKSSLVQAGLVPRLRQGRWQVITMRPGAEPLVRLHARLVELCGPEAVARVARDPAALAAAPGRAGSLLRRRAADSASSILLFVDQLEELVTHGVPQRAQRAFIDAIAAMADDAAGPLRVVVALRDDFLGRLSRDLSLREALASNLLLLAPPDADGLGEALRAPAQRAGHELEAGLADEMVAALRDELAPLPLLQLAASRLWQHRDQERRLLTRAALAAAGGVAGILAAHAGEVLEHLPGDDEQHIARRLLCDLVTPDGTRRRVGRHDLCARCADPVAAAHVLERLISGRLLTSLRADGIDAVELAHESMIAGWPRLRAWREEDRSDGELRERLRQAATLWAERRRPRELLWRGDALEEAGRWRRRDAGSALGRDEQAFLLRSEAAARRVRRARRGLVAAIAVLAIAGAVTSTVTVRAARESARQARLRVVMRELATTEDPLVGALVLAEFEGRPEPPGGLAAAAHVAAQPIPISLYRRQQPLIVGDVSRDGVWAAVTGGGANRGEVSVFRTDGSGTPIVLRGHTLYVEDVSFSRDGKHLVSAGADATVRVWRADGAGEPIVLPHGGEVESAVFEPDDEHVLTVAPMEHAVRLWRSDGQGAPVVFAHSGKVWTADVSRDGSRVVTAAYDGLRVWRVDGTPLFRAPGVYAGARLSPDGTKILAAQGKLGGLQLQVYGADLASSVVLPGALAPMAFRVPMRLLAPAEMWSPDSQRIVHRTTRGAAVSRADGSGTLLEIDARGAGRTNLLVRFSPDGSRVLIEEDEGLRVVFADGARDAVQLRGHGGVAAGYFSADGEHLLSVSNDGTARVWPLGDPPGARTLSEDEPIRGLAWGPDGRLLLTTSSDGTARLWPAGGGAPRVIGDRGTVRTTFGAFHPDGTRFAVSRDDGLEVRSVADGALLARPIAGVAVGGVEFSPDGRWLAAESGVGAPPYTLWVFSVDGSRPPARRELIDLPFWVSFSADSTHLAVASYLGGRVWPIDLGGDPVMLRTIPGPRQALYRPDGDLIMTLSAARKLQFWTPGGEERPALARPGGVRAAWSRDGELVAVGMTDGSVVVTRLDGGDEPIVLRGHDDAVTALAFGPGRQLATAAGRSVRIWRLDWPTMLAGLRASTTACLLPDKRIAYLDEPPERARATWSDCERRHGRVP